MAAVTGCTGEYGSQVRDARAPVRSAWMLRTGVVALVVVCAFVHCPVALSKDTILSGGWSGDRQCPCFCSERDSDDFSPYWNANFGFNYVDGIGCATPCQTDTSMMGNCAQHVDYRFCVRRMNNSFPLTTAAGLETDKLIAMMDRHVLGCTSDLTWDEDSGDCMDTIKRAACYMVFPKCSDTDEALEVCKSVCENERIACRELNSNWGTVETFGCGAYANEVGPSPLCTGGVASTGPLAATVVAVLALAAALVLT